MACSYPEPDKEYEDESKSILEEIRVPEVEEDSSSDEEYVLENSNENVQAHLAVVQGMHPVRIHPQTIVTAIVVVTPTATRTYKINEE